MAAPIGNDFATGRPKGQPNKITAKTRELFAHILEEEQNNFIEALEKVRAVSPKDYVLIMIKLSERFVPPVTKTEITGPDGEEFRPIQIILPKPPEDEEY
jgi:hypothetical protein